MKLLVTGGTGFLGRHVVARAVAERCEVVFSGRSADAAASVMRATGGAAHWIPLDHGCEGAVETLAAAMQGADAVIHCAALSSPWGSSTEFERINVSGTREVLVAAHEARVTRLVHVSTPSLYFGFRDQSDIREDAPLPRPANDYARSKRAAEGLIQDAPLPETVILRPRALFGPWDRTLMPRLLRVMRRGRVPIMRGAPILLDLTYIDNAVDAVWLALTKPLPGPLRIYNVSNGEPWELRALLDLTARSFGLPLRTLRVPWALVDRVAWGLESWARLTDQREPAITRYSAGVLAFTQTLDIAAIRQDLGYVPEVGVAEGIRRHAAWWRTEEARGT